MYYDQLQSQLVVTVLQVEGLMEQKHRLQPFVKLSLMWSDSVGVEVEDSTDDEVIFVFMSYRITAPGKESYLLLWPF